jgi:putative ABC transport system permease protein
MVADLRIAMRGLGRSTGFAAAATVTLALGIAATSTIFSVVYGVLLRPLPYADVSRLVLIQGEKAYSTGPRIMNFSAPELEPFAGAARAFSSIAMSGTTVLTYRGDTSAESVSAATVSGDFFATLGTPPLLGRVLGSEDDPNLVISERLWQRLFGGAPDVIGRSITLSDATHERIYMIVGVMPATFQLPFARTDAWRPLGYARVTGDQRVRELVVGGHEIYARIKDGLTFEQARSDAASVVDAVLKPHFTTSRIDMYAKVSPLDTHVRGAIGPTLWVLMGAVALVLLVACTNVANLILVRHTSRAREISVRLALGASKRRLLTFLLSESVIIAAAGAGIGIAIAFAAVRGLQWLQPAQIPRLDAVRVDLPVLLFAAACAAASVVLAAWSPAVLATRGDGAVLLRAGARSTPGRSTRWLRSGLVIVEIATSIVLIVGASLLGRTLAALLATDLGVNTENVIAANLDMSPGPGRAIDETRRAQIVRELEDRLAAHPEVRAAGVGLGVPPTGEMMRVSFVFSNGRTTDSHMVTSVLATPGYFRTLQIRLLAGRVFDASDTAASAPVVIVNREAARRFFAGDNPIGRTLPVMNADRTIVGVVDNVKYTGIAAGPEGVIYLPYAQSAFRMAVLFARTAADPNAIAGDIRRIVGTYDAGIGVPRIQTLDAWIADATAQPRFRMVLLSAIAGIALVLAMVGLYGVVAYSTAQRTTEIGVRMAVGAQPTDVVRLVVTEGARLAVGGIAAGLALSWWLTRLLTSFLYGVSATDATTFAAAAASLLLIALAATFIPAWRAARIDPAVALRAE